MTPERWERIKQTLERAISLDMTARAAYLASACADDADLRAEVESLLDSHDAAGDAFLQTPINDVRQRSSETSAALSHVGRRIGAYDLVEQIGHGGMGEVYRAVRADGQFSQEVALKRVRSGLDTADVLERFRAERQILATLDHPLIARLFDGGTADDGVPYLVMELVRGVPLDRYCDERRLDITARLRLFLQVCTAVEYAHQRLIVHRDLKPSNVLVTVDGIPKLLDFGIAKIVDAMPTNRTATRAMTLEYASPEQVRGDTITTATDVYALGVVLYRLLTGRFPHQVSAQSLHELAVAITSQDPRSPSAVVAPADEDATAAEAASLRRESTVSALQRRLSGDLDNILLTALRKEPERRYRSVAEFAQDIENHLRGLPVSAVPDRWTYRTGKFVGRHRLSLAATAVVLLVILAGAVFSLEQARRARRAQAIAEERFDMVRRLAKAVVFEFNDALERVPGTTAARKLIVTRATEYLDSLSKEQANDMPLERELADAYVRIGDVLGNPYHPNLGDTEGALIRYRRAVELYEQLERRDPSAETRSGLAQAYMGLGAMFWSAGNGRDARGSYVRALAIYEDLTRRDARFRRDNAGAAYYLGQTDLRFGNPREAVVSFEHARSDYERVVAEAPDDDQSRRSLGLTDLKLADVKALVGDEEAAADVYQQASRELESVLATRPSSNDLQRLVAYVWLRRADQDAVIAPAEREALARRAIAMLRPQVDADPSNTQATLDWASAYQVLGNALADARRDADASAALHVSSNSFERLLAINPGYIEARRELASTRRLIGRAAMRRHAPRAALVEYQRARAALEAPDLVRQAPRTLAQLYADMGDAYVALVAEHTAGARDAAADCYRRSEAKWAEIAAGQPLSAGNSRLRREVVRKLAVLE